MSDTSSRISVSEDKLKLLFAEFKLELVKEMGSFARVSDVEKWRDSFERRLRNVEDTQFSSTAVSRNQKWILGLAVTFASAVVGALIFLVSSGAH